VTPTLTAISQSLSTSFGVALPVTLTGTDTNNPGGPAAFSIVATPAHGTLSGTLPNVTYTPNAGYYGTDTFSFTVGDGTLTSSPASVVVTVAPAISSADIAVEQPAGTGLTDGASTVAFGNVLTGSNATLQFVVRNAGTGPLTISGVSIDGFNAAEFAAGNSISGQLGAGGIAYLNVTFTPAFPGSKTAALHILSDDPDEGSFDVALSGAGTAPGGAVALVRDINRTGGGISPTQPLVVGSQVFSSARRSTRAPSCGGRTARRRAHTW